jgi:hypothetical protein
MGCLDGGTVPGVIIQSYSLLCIVQEFLLQFNRCVDGENVETRKKIYCYKKVACVGVAKWGGGFKPGPLPLVVQPDFCHVSFWNVASICIQSYSKSICFLMSVR